MDASLVNHLFKLLNAFNKYEFYVDAYCNLISDKVVVVLVINLCFNTIMKSHKVEYSIPNLI